MVVVELTSLNIAWNETRFVEGHYLHPFPISVVLTNKLANTVNSSTQCHHQYNLQPSAWPQRTPINTFSGVVVPISLIIP
jgi:hypothetical protein